MDKTALLAVTAALTGFSSQLSGLDLTGIPPALAAQLKDFKASMDEALAKMNPTDQVPAAMDAAWALNSMTSALRRAAEFTDRVLAEMKRISGELEPKAVALQGLQTRVDKGELLASDEVERRARKGIELVESRRAHLKSSGLPEPDIQVLLCADDEWGKRVAEAADRKRAMEGRVAPEAPPVMVQLCFGPREAFDLAIAVMPKAGKPAPAATTNSRPEPVVGAGSGGGGAKRALAWA